MFYNLTLLENATSILQPMQVANSFVNNLWGLFILIIVGGALFFSVRTENRNRESFVASMFIITILAGFLTLLGLIDTMLFGACVIILVFATLFLINQR